MLNFFKSLDFLGRSVHYKDINQYKLDTKKRYSREGHLGSLLFLFLKNNFMFSKTMGIKKIGIRCLVLSLFILKKYKI